tara:strand:- start:269 stop:766 length:498 start_codon:yes stop_codon:yes gene_type:complete
MQTKTTFDLIKSTKLNDLKKCLELNIKIVKSSDENIEHIYKKILKLCSLLEHSIENNDSIEDINIKNTILSIIENVTIIISPDITNRQLIHLILPKYLEKKFNSKEIYHVYLKDGNIEINNQKKLTNELKYFKMCCYCGNQGNYYWEDSINQQIIKCDNSNHKAI